MNLNRDKFYIAINEYLNENMNAIDAHYQTELIVQGIIDTIESIDDIINHSNSECILLSKKFHTLKNMLLYGDFYYESDLCQDIEISLRKNKDITKIIPIYEEILNNLKM